MLSVNEAKSFITAYAMLKDGKLLIGEGACYNPDAIKRKDRFKSRFLVDPEASKDIKSFASGVLGELYLSGQLIQGEDCCFYIGCPAGWDRVAREEYRQIFEQTGYPPAKIISESSRESTSKCIYHGLDFFITKAHLYAKMSFEDELNCLSGGSCHPYYFALRSKEEMQ